MRTLPILILLATVLVGCDNRSDSSGSYDAELERQFVEYDAQSTIVDRQLKKSGEQASRFDVLLDRWEAQADRQDRILDEKESKLGGE